MEKFKKNVRQISTLFLYWMYDNPVSTLECTTNVDSILKKLFFVVEPDFNRFVTPVSQLSVTKQHSFVNFLVFQKITAGCLQKSGSSREAKRMFLDSGILPTGWLPQRERLRRRRQL